MRLKLDENLPSDLADWADNCGHATGLPVLLVGAAEPA